MPKEPVKLSEIYQRLSMTFCGGVIVLRFFIYLVFIYLLFICVDVYLVPYVNYPSLLT